MEQPVGLREAFPFVLSQDNDDERRGPKGRDADTKWEQTTRPPPWLGEFDEPATTMLTAGNTEEDEDVVRAFLDPAWVAGRQREEVAWESAVNEQALSPRRKVLQAKNAELTGEVKQLWRSLLSISLHKELRGLEKLPSRSGGERSALLNQLCWAQSFIAPSADEYMRTGFTDPPPWAASAPLQGGWGGPGSPRGSMFTPQSTVGSFGTGRVTLGGGSGGWTTGGFPQDTPKSASFGTGRVTVGGGGGWFEPSLQRQQSGSDRGSVFQMAGQQTGGVARQSLSATNLRSPKGGVSSSGSPSRKSHSGVTPAARSDAPRPHRPTLAASLGLPEMSQHPKKSRLGGFLGEWYSKKRAWNVRMYPKFGTPNLVVRRNTPEIPGGGVVFGNGKLPLFRRGADILRGFFYGFQIDQINDEHFPVQKCHGMTFAFGVSRTPPGDLRGRASYAYEVPTSVLVGYDSNVVLPMETAENEEVKYSADNRVLPPKPRWLKSKWDPKELRRGDQVGCLVTKESDFVAFVNGRQVFRVHCKALLEDEDAGSCPVEEDLGSDTEGEDEEDGDAEGKMRQGRRRTEFPTRPPLYPLIDLCGRVASVQLVKTAAPPNVILKQRDKNLDSVLGLTLGREPQQLSPRSQKKGSPRSGRIGSPKSGR